MLSSKQLCCNVLSRQTAVLKMYAQVISCVKMYFQATSCAKMNYQANSCAVMKTSQKILTSPYPVMPVSVTSLQQYQGTILHRRKGQLQYSSHQHLLVDTGCTQKPWLSSFFTFVALLSKIAGKRKLCNKFSFLNCLMSHCSCGREGSSPDINNSMSFSLKWEHLTYC